LSTDPVKEIKITDGTFPKIHGFMFVLRKALPGKTRHAIFATTFGVENRILTSTDFVELRAKFLDLVRQLIEGDW
jgi:hypothetical protein